MSPGGCGHGAVWAPGVADPPWVEVPVALLGCTGSRGVAVCGLVDEPAQAVAAARISAAAAAGRAAGTPPPAPGAPGPRGVGPGAPGGAARRRRGAPPHPRA